MSLLQVPIALALIGGAGVGKLADDWLGFPSFKWVAPLEVTSPMELEESLVLLLAPLELDVSVLTGCNAVGQFLP